MIRILLLLALTAATAAAQVSTTAIDGLREKRMPFVAFVNCTAVPSPGTKIDSAVIIVRGERIVSVGRGLAIPPGADVRDLRGAWVYAGFIEPFLPVSALGQAKDASAGGARWEEDESPVTPRQQGAHYWNQAVRPERRASDALTISPDAAKEWQKLGFTAAATVSNDGILRGSAASVLLRAGTASETIINDGVYQALSFTKGSSKTPYPSSQMGSIALIRQAFYDADWYGRAHAMAARGSMQRPPEFNHSLDALRTEVTAKTPFVSECIDEHDISRWNRIAKEFSLSMLMKGTGTEFRRLSMIAKIKPDMILPVNLPKVPDVRDANGAYEIGLSDLMTWYWSADNARLLDSVGVRFAFTTDGLKDRSAFLGNVRECVQRGLRPDVALAAMTTEAARIAGLADRAGKIEQGYYANFVVMSKPIFETGSEIRAVVVAGAENTMYFPADVDLRGHWTLSSSGLPGGKALRASITGTAENPSLEVRRDSVTLPSTLSLQSRRISFTVTTDTVGLKGTVRAASLADSVMITGEMILPNGTMASFVLRRDSLLRDAKKSEPAVAGARQRKPLPMLAPFGPFGLEGQPKQLSVVLKNARVWTSGPSGILDSTDVVIRDGKIAAIGKGLTADTTIDCTGMQITPGIIDEHSHIAISRGVNEGTHAVTTEVRIGDVLNPDDVNIYRQLSGGVTSTHLLHGSANPMGGQLQYIKTRWGADAEDLKVEGSVPTVKFALGENVKQANWGDRYTVRYPQTRMGVEEIMRDAFRTAKEYERDLRANDPTKPVRRDLQLDALVEIANSKRNIHCHSYVQSEILMLMRLAEEFGFRVHTFTHILEGYKVAKEMAKHGARASSFADWWAYKFEVYDAIPESPAIMHEQGVMVSINSDDAEMARRLNQEAAKSIKYGGVSEEDALKFVTINAAKQMAIDQRLGSIEVGKDADVVVWTGNPLSNMSRVERTFVDGRQYFARDVDQKLRKRDAELRAFLEQEAITAIGQGAASTSAGRGPRREYHCDTADDEVAGSALDR
ncbi:MAG: amidohydrolase family protein [Candidatus Kapaibacterium sp.]